MDERYRIENGEGIIPEGSTSIVDDGFCYDGEIVEDNEDLKIITIPASVKEIGSRAFSQCVSLEEIIIPEGVTRIGEYAFYGCTGLKRIYIPSSVTLIENMALTGCYSLTEIVISKDNPIYDSRNNCNALIETASNKLIYGCGGTIIPDTVTSIEDGAFHGSETLKEIEIPASVKEIGMAAFGSCPALERIVLPESITSI